MLGGFGARPDDPTLLDRGHTLGWLVLAALVLLAVTVAGLVPRNSARSCGVSGT